MLIVWEVKKIEKMKSWTKLLPFFVVSWYAKKNLQVSEIEIGGKKVKVVRPYKGVYIQI